MLTLIILSGLRELIGVQVKKITIWNNNFIINQLHQLYKLFSDVLTDSDSGDFYKGGITTTNPC
jgi:hypothetical protein